jgi:hypothetical protein
MEPDFEWGFWEYAYDRDEDSWNDEDFDSDWEREHDDFFYDEE